MKPNEEAVLKAVRAVRWATGDLATVGQVAKVVNLSVSTIRRICIELTNQGYLWCDFVPYKSTGARLYKLTDEGHIFLEDRTRGWQ